MVKFDLTKTGMLRKLKDTQDTVRMSSEDELVALPFFVQFIEAMATCVCDNGFEDPWNGLPNSVEQILTRFNVDSVTTTTLPARNYAHDNSPSGGVNRVR